MYLTRVQPSLSAFILACSTTGEQSVALCTVAVGFDGTRSLEHTVLVVYACLHVHERRREGQYNFLTLEQLGEGRC